MALTLLIEAASEATSTLLCSTLAAQLGNRCLAFNGDEPEPMAVLANCAGTCSAVLIRRWNPMANASVMDVARWCERHDKVLISTTSEEPADLDARSPSIRVHLHGTAPEALAEWRWGQSTVQLPQEMLLSALDAIHRFTDTYEFPVCPGQGAARAGKAAGHRGENGCPGGWRRRRYDSAADHYFLPETNRDARAVPQN